MTGMTLALVLALQSAGGAAAGSPDSTPGTEIVVIAQRNADALAKCLREGCPPIDDIRASIAVAENLFVNGDYRQARSLLARSIDRNKRYAGELPAAVAALYEASSNVNLHYGDEIAYRRNVASQVDILRDAAPPGSSQKVLAATLLGDMWLTLGNISQAERSYRAAASEAAAIGQPRLGVFIDLRRVAMDLAKDDFGSAEKSLRAAEQGPFATDQGVAAAVSAMRVRLASARKDGEGLDRALAALAALPPGREPVLLHADPIRPSAAMDAERTSLEWLTRLGTAQLGSGKLRWIDVGFSITPQGRTRDVEVLRGQMAGERIDAVLQHIAGRRYAPFAPEDGAGGTYRVERYTLRGAYGMVTGSWVRRRAGAPQFEMIDITRSHAPPPDAEG